MLIFTLKRLATLCQPILFLSLCSVLAGWVWGSRGVPPLHPSNPSLPMSLLEMLEPSFQPQLESWTIVKVPIFRDLGLCRVCSRLVEKLLLPLGLELSMQRLQDMLMKALGGSDEAEVGLKGPPDSQIDALAMYIRDLPSNLFKQEHGTGMIPHFGVSVSSLVHPDRHVCDSQGQDSPSQYPAEQIRPRKRDSELFCHGFVHNIHA